jgi:hypothetical protein
MNIRSAARVGLRLFAGTLGFAVGMVALFPGLWMLRVIRQPVFLTPTVEEMRVMNPAGDFDAVMTRDKPSNAAPDGTRYLFIVPEGNPAPSARHRFLERSPFLIMRADSMQGETVVWKQEHVLEVHYHRAKIAEFRNLWTSSEALDLNGSGEVVEIRLVQDAKR